MDDPQTQQQEPSMEEILASIRRIISEDADEPGDDASAMEEAPADEEAPQAFDDPIETEPAPPPPPEPMPEPAPVAAMQAAAPVDDDVLELTNVVEPADPAPYGVSGGRADDGSALISDRTADLAQSAFARLNGSGNRLYSDLPIGDGRTVEDLVRELLKPMLKEWLDANLPEIVERLVDREVQYIGRGGGRH